jgi:hypothetical protein
VGKEARGGYFATRLDLDQSCGVGAPVYTSFLI